MAECRRYCALIHKARLDAGFTSVKYPLFTATLNRYFLPEFRELIADECNLIGYMDIPAVEFDWNQKEEVVLDLQRSPYQQELYEERCKRSEIAKAKKNAGLK